MPLYTNVEFLSVCKGKMIEKMFSKYFIFVSQNNTRVHKSSKNLGSAPNFCAQNSDIKQVSHQTPKTLGATIQLLIDLVTWHPRFVHPCSNIQFHSVILHHKGIFTFLAYVNSICIISFSKTFQPIQSSSKTSHSLTTKLETIKGFTKLIFNLQ